MHHRLGKIGVYGPLQRKLQRRLSFEAFGLSWKTAYVYRYLGDRNKLTPQLSDLGCKTFFEVPDRAYEDVPVEIPIGMEPVSEGKTDFSRFGLISPLTDEITFRVHIDDYEQLGRALVVGDVIEIPFFRRTQIGREKEGEKSFFLEITDVDDTQEVEKFIHIFHASTLKDSRATREIPIDNSNRHVIDDFMEQMDEHHASEVIRQDTTLDPKPEQEPVDYRRPLQRAYTDDPNATRKTDRGIPDNVFGTLDDL